MIYIARGAPPDGFLTNTRRWLADFQAAKRRNPKLTPSKSWTNARRRKPMRRYAQTLYDRFHGKCAFCESKMRHVAPGQIEHYRPKSVYSDLMFVWENWLLACPTCNSHKGADFPLDENGQAYLLDPASEDPTPHFGFVRAEMLPLTKRAEESMRLVNLHRLDLLEVRAQWLMQIDLLLLLILYVPPIRDEVRTLLIWAMQPDAPYAAMTRAYLTEKTPKLANPPEPHAPVDLADPLDRIVELMNQHSQSLATVVH